MKKTAFLIMFVTIISKVLGFGRDVILSYFYGASQVSDAYLIALTIPVSIFSFLGTGVFTGYIPMYSKIEKEQGGESGNRYTNNLINILMIICTAMVVLSVLFTRQLVGLFASGFSGDTMDMAVRFTRVSLVGMYFTACIYVFRGYLQIKDKFLVPAMIGFPLNLFTIMAIVISSRGNEMILVVGTVFAMASQLLFMLPFILKSGYRHRIFVDFKDKYIKSMAVMAVPIIIGTSVDQINVLVDRTLASRIAVGGISALNYASKLNEFVHGLFVMSLAIVMYPLISKMAADDDMEGLKKTVRETSGSIILIVVPVTVGAMVFARPVVELLFGRGAFDRDAVTMTSTVLFFYAIGMIGYGLREILSRTFYAIQDTKTPMINGIAAMVLNVVLNLILSRIIGLGGLALSTSISAIFCTGLLMLSLRKKIGALGLRSMASSFVKVLLSSLVMGAIAKLVYGFAAGTVPAALALAAAVATGAAVFFVLVYLLKVDEVYGLVDMARRKLGKG